MDTGDYHFDAPASTKSRAAKSGLGSFKREWNDDVQVSQSSAVEWDASPEPPARTFQIASAVKQEYYQPPPGMTAAERRRAIIQATISQESGPSSTANSPSSSAISTLSGTTAASSSTSKRAASKDQSSEPPSKKSRVMPWDSNHSKLKAKKANTPILGTSAPPPKPGPSVPLKLEAGQMSVASKITLSSEQQHVLKLILEGKNVFFTGSAGKAHKHLLWTKTQTLYLPLRYRKVCSAPRSHPEFATQVFQIC